MIYICEIYMTERIFIFDFDGICLFDFDGMFIKIGLSRGSKSDGECLVK